jgi:heat shock protein HtpX
VYFQKQILFSFTGSREIERKENPELYNIVENLCISRGIPMPKIGIIDDGSMNAFATGWSEKNSYVVFSK